VWGRPDGPRAAANPRLHCGDGPGRGRASVPAGELPVSGHKVSRRDYNNGWPASELESHARREFSRIRTGAWPSDPSKVTDSWSHLLAPARDKVLGMSSDPEIIEGLRADSRAARASNGREERSGSRRVSLTSEKLGRPDCGFRCLRPCRQAD
jgi:hypothetical protein